MTGRLDEPGEGEVFVTVTAGKFTRTGKKGVIIDIKVKAGSSHKNIHGVRGDRLVVSVHSPPEKGKANRELLKFLAEILDLPASRLKIIKGEKSRNKSILIENTGAKEVEGRLSAPLYKYGNAPRVSVRRAGKARD